MFSHVCFSAKETHISAKCALSTYYGTLTFKILSV